MRNPNKGGQGFLNQVPTLSDGLAVAPAITKGFLEGVLVGFLYRPNIWNRVGGYSIPSGSLRLMLEILPTLTQLRRNPYRKPYPKPLHPKSVTLGLKSLPDLAPKGAAVESAGAVG